MTKPIDPKLAKFIAESKVKHRVYHGTMSDVKKFKTPAYFGGKDVANQFSDPEYLFGSSELNEGEHPNVIPVHLNLKNPKIFTKEEDYEKHVMDGGLDPQRWIKKGHDGVIYAPNGDIEHPDAYYVAFHPNQIKSAIGNRGTYSKRSGDITMDKGGSVEPKQTVKAYKMFRVDPKQPGKLFPLFVNANTPVPMNEWIDAEEGEMSNGKVKSKIGPLAYRPGWHAGDLPLATHIGDKDEEQKAETTRINKLRDAMVADLGYDKEAQRIAKKMYPYPSWVNAPRLRNPRHMWAEIEMPHDVDWQSEAEKRGYNDKGKFVASEAHITDQLPKGGHYRYKTNANMTGNWLIGGAMKVNRILDDAEVKSINKAAGTTDLPRLTPMKKEKFGFAGGGSVAPDEWKAEEHVNYRDPKTTKIEDWKWRKLKEVLTDVPLTEVPDYIQKGYGEFMNQQLSKAKAGQLTPRDLLKAFTITQSSIGRGGLSHASATKTGMKLPNTGEEVRPEGAFAEWLGSPMGQRYLNAAERGLIHHPALGDIQQKFAPFGKHNQLVDQMAYAAQMMPKLAQTMNQAVTGGKDEYRDWAEQMRGIAGAKSGFIGSMLGRGDLPTLDARQLNLHTLPAKVGVGSIMSRGKGTGAREAVDRLASRQQAMNLNVDPSMMPHYQHLTHHAVWDAMGKNKTTHDDLVRAMRGYADGGAARMAKGGNPTVEEMRRAIAKASGSNPPMAEKNLTTLQDFHTTLGDKVRAGVMEAKKQMDAFDYKYDKGHRVFTEDSAKKNRAPYEILERHRHGNQLMWEGKPWNSKKIIDPETGKAKRTPYEPAYRVRGEIGEMILPESAIKGRVDMARGGLVHMAEGGDVNKAKFLAKSKIKERLYHGTTKDFGSFSHKHQYSGEGGSHSGSGFYFTDNPESASRYSMMRGESGSNVMPVHLNIKKPLHFDWEQGETTGAKLKLTPAQVRSIMLAHPKIKDEDESPLTNWGDIRGASFNKTLNDAVNSYAGSSMLAALRNDFFGDNHEQWLRALHKATGYDSGTTVTPNGERHYIAWFPEQIKSAIGNRGTYDTNVADITKKRGGRVTHAHHLDIEERPL